MTQVEVNYIAVLAGAVSSMIVGSLWYSPLLFAKQWMKLVGATESSMKEANMTVFMVKMIVVSLVEAYILFHFQKMVGVMSISDAASLAFWAWLGFTAATMGANYIAAKKPLNLYLIDAGYHLVNLVVMSVIVFNLS